MMATTTEPNDAPAHALDRVVDQLAGKRVVVLTGAGVSTESGIPDYRSPESAAKVRRPIHGPEFVRSAALRRRYWARALVGWERFSRSASGAGARRDRASRSDGVVTD